MLKVLELKRSSRIALISFDYLQWLGIGGLLARPGGLVRFWHRQFVMMLLSSLLGSSHQCSSCDSPTVVGCVGVSPTVRYLSDIIPMPMHASLLRNSMSVLLVTYVTCHVYHCLPDWSFPEYLCCLQHAFSCLLE